MTSVHKGKNKCFSKNLIYYLPANKIVPVDMSLQSYLFVIFVDVEFVSVLGLDSIS